jgi:hypothetical protein
MEKKKIKFTGLHFFAHDHMNATEYKEGQYVETEDEYFFNYVINAGWAVEAQRERKVEKVDIPAENKALDSVPEENKASLHAVNEAQKKPAKKRTSKKKT